MKSKKKYSYSLLYHLKIIFLLVFFAGLPLAIIAGVYQQTTIISRAQVSQIMPNDILPRLTPPPGCYYTFDNRACPLAHARILCRPGQYCGCPPILICPSITPIPSISISPNPSCIPAPPCAYATPRCEVAMPEGGWCPPALTPPALSITPFPHCFPRPACLDGNPPCKIPEPAVKWCPPTTVTPVPVRTGNTFLIYLNTVLHQMFGK